ncbi:kinesin family member 17 [Thecamonas trahens ATCC 50062]|uniref:Kinesin family member 17 n=1 Tax=Thecamonas trahens ATCC 50062 TaxID=461836 RepID=A0A0L0DTE9_THETB|nr:kinesin family member 17 [Thecamonas trahens ATCC 50062]KNC55589.1 kinesin family member 17 [Thecamonas trahens ATCC 50062]|eukprot:XP_013761362.1 kinesin family member 17 [Thecamonas trahens ATCC 50062]
MAGTSKGGQSESVLVVVRPRPFLERELETERVVHVVNPQTLIIDKYVDDPLRYMFDTVLTEQASQEEVYGQVAPIVDGVLNGINGTIFAYGQTSTGKTYTMLGAQGLASWADDESEGGSGGADVFGAEAAPADDGGAGLIPRAVQTLFAAANRAGESGDAAISMYCSYLEIYNEKLYDLLQYGAKTKRDLSIMEDKERGVYAHGAREIKVSSPRQVFNLMQQGLRRRAVASTALNQLSSRSHTIFQVFVETVVHETGKILRGKLNLWDVGQHTYVADATELKELRNINQSLSALGNCVNALSQRGRTHIPYRDSKLTRLLQDSLGGNTRTAFIATVSPSVDSVEESVQTLKFMERSKKIKLTVCANESENPAVQLQRYKAELARMRALQEGRLPPSAEHSGPAAGGPGGACFSQTAIPHGMELIPSEQLSRLYSQLEASERLSLGVREKLAQSRNLLHREREERAKLNVVINTAIAQIRTSGPMTSKREEAAVQEAAVLREENAYLQRRLETLEAGADALSARAAELAEYQAWLEAVPVETTDSSADSEHGDEGETMSPAAKIELLLRAKQQSELELLATKRKFVGFCEQVQGALQAKVHELETVTKREKQTRAQVAQLQAALAKARAPSSPKEAGSDAAAGVTKQHLFLLLEKEAQIKAAQETVLATLEAVDTTLEETADAIMGVQFSSKLPKIRSQLVRALESATDEIHRLEDALSSGRSLHMGTSTAAQRGQVATAAVSASTSLSSESSASSAVLTTQDLQTTIKTSTARSGRRAERRTTSRLAATKAGGKRDPALDAARAFGLPVNMSKVAKTPAQMAARRAARPSSAPGSAPAPPQATESAHSAAGSQTSGSRTGQRKRVKKKRRVVAASALPVPTMSGKSRIPARPAPGPAPTTGVLRSDPLQSLGSSSASARFDQFGRLIK